MNKMELRGILMELQPWSLESPYQLPHPLSTSSEKSKCIKEKKKEQREWEYMYLKYTDKYLMISNASLLGKTWIQECSLDSL